MLRPALVLLACLSCLCGSARAETPPESPEASLAAAALGRCGPVNALAEAADARSGPDPQHAGIVLVAARCLLLTGEGEAATVLLEGMAPDPVTAPWRAALQAQALLLPHPGPAPVPESVARSVVTRLEGVSLPGDPGLEVRLIRDRAYVFLGKGLEVREDLRELLDTRLAPEARYWLAAAALLRGDYEPARRTFLATWIRHAASPWADHAATQLAEMGYPVPDYRTEAGRDAARRRAEALLEENRAAEALTIVKALESRGFSPDTPDGHAEMARICFAARDYEAAVRWYARAGSPEAPTVPGGAETLFHHALARSRTGDYAGAATIYTRLYERFPTTRRGDQASYKIGYLAYDEGRLAEAIEAFRAHLDRYPDSRHADETLWFVGWSAWRLQRTDEAREAWNALVAAYPASSLAAGARYWLARSRQEDREGYLRAVLKASPHSSYAWFAARALGFPSPEKAVPPAESPIPEGALAGVRSTLTLADLFLAAGYQDLARPLLQEVASHAETQEARLALAPRLVATGDIQDARRLAGTRCTDVRGRPLLRELCLPRPHVRILQEVMAGSGLDPYLPYAIMTAESAMRPGVTSPAGARGLMQLMPHKARELHEARFPEQPFDPDDLYLGGYNALLGTSELVGLYRRYRERGHEQPLPLVIAAYNAGTEAVDRWLEAGSTEAGGPVAMDVFAENIGYTETRRYVRRVLGTLQRYHRAYGDAP